MCSIAKLRTVNTAIRALVTATAPSGVLDNDEALISLVISSAQSLSWYFAQFKNIQQKYGVTGCEREMNRMQIYDLYHHSEPQMVVITNSRVHPRKHLQL
jgi:hypothetical protein